MTAGQPPVASVTVGTRGSRLARAQTERVISLLRAAWPGLRCELRAIVTRGDRTQASGEPLPEIGGKGLFTAELEQALRAGEIDLAVHSLKDLPTEDPPGIALGAVCLREDVQDCLVARGGLTLAELPDGAVVGTSSLRRAAQLRALRPDLEVRSIRGNVDTRVRKVRDGEIDAVVLAAAGVYRLGLEDAVSEWLGETMLPAPGQGALAVQCRAGDEAVLRLLAAIDDEGARTATSAERAFLRALGAGCTAPVAAYAEPAGRGVHLVGMVASGDGSRVVRVEGEGGADEVGERLAREALAAGAAAILAEIRAGAGRPLAGRRVAVTRPREQSATLADALERLGAAVSIVPLVAIEPVEEAALDPGEAYDLVIFTSANAVAATAERLRGPPLSAVRVAAVGPATADAVRALGVEPSFVPERFDADALAEGLGELEGARVLLPQADIADSELAERLRAAGAAVDVLVAYRTVSLEPDAEGLRALVDADAVLLASGSAARSLAATRALGESALVVCIGASTAEAARGAGLRVDLVASEATGEGMIQALVSHFRERA